MEIIKAVLPWVQIVVSVAVIALILLQRNDAALGGVFGGGDNVAHTKRGIERGLFMTTVGLAILFVLTAVLSLLFQTI
ncbi:MAG: preprotein translocase subunit SecG [archaeon]